MKQRLIKLLTLFSFLIILTGCGEKKLLQVNDFIYTMQQKGYEVKDYSNEFNSYKSINKVINAKNSDKYQIEYYQISTEDDAKLLYNNNLKYIASIYNSSANTSISDANYDKYTITTSDWFITVTRVENTMIYIKGKSIYKDDIKNLLKEIGY